MQPMTWNPALTFRKDSKSSHKIILIKSCHLVYCFYNNIKDQQIFCRCEERLVGNGWKPGGWVYEEAGSKAKSPPERNLSLSLSPIYILPASFFVAFIFLAFFYFVYKISLLRGLKFTVSAVFESGPSTTPRRLTVQPAWLNPVRASRLQVALTRSRCFLSGGREYCGLLVVATPFDFIRFIPTFPSCGFPKQYQQRPPHSLYWFYHNS